MAADYLQTDVVIVGAGLVGLTAAIALSRLGKRVVLTDAKPIMALPEGWVNDTAHWDTRIYALTNATVSWLTDIGVWQHLPASRVTPIAAMHLWSPTQVHDTPDIRLTAEEAHLPHMGYIVESWALMNACWQALNRTDVTIITDAPATGLQHCGHIAHLTLAGREIEAQLVIGADGARSWVREQCAINTEVFDFAQTALVTNYISDQPHGDIARQWFGIHETLALLPMPQQQVSLVWALSHVSAQAKLQLSQQALATEVAARCGMVAGTLRPHGEVVAFPLLQKTAVVTALPNVMLLGDAAHQVHPMAGQGVNLGFGDVMTLCTHMQRLPRLQPIGHQGFLQRVARARKTDIAAMHALTRGLDSLFSRSQAGWTHAAVLGLRGLENSAMLKRFLIRTATGA
ncbi:FAD-dependent monooxygenase [Methylophilus aquaticus]|uniref:FAD-dependent monooxygenase n=1 Tax=Methylophilus aquaticus TaxID=1971610 RepID=A0ABT9JSS7_9PROT|nr:FAD-dependent monooxygenase [Methylophilus aquaticus]MDP8567519.1 FAD-dependent monooxygenase [Methylophilus aquaticus]